ncbi:unnamed protein product [Parascedosporium putredinis]|uniref:MYND-type domain-containing protein n=1 Tax=Parascedosporium putredinis TaxID=1442378 RepID=A0A9P1M6V8_9PEZI|nr:unnamed protein product [Parascedosporium putredinis]CAI7989239.1 unnamed protein product [Parascedosporium putredinis]
MEVPWKGDEDALVYPDLLARRKDVTAKLEEEPYDILLYLERASVHRNLDYPDLAAGDAYRALLLSDDIKDDAAEYHEAATESFRNHVAKFFPSASDAGADEEATLCKMADACSLRAYNLLSASLYEAGCLKSAYEFCERALELDPQQETKKLQERILAAGRRRLKREDVAGRICRIGASRGEKCILGTTTKPTGLFADEDITAGEAVLKEYSLLTANNRFKDLLCDACGEELPRLGDSSGESVSCPECYDTVFCSPFCFEQAQEKYHPAVCEKEVDSIGKDPKHREADQRLHMLLLARVLAMSACQEVHPLDILEVKYIWGDFVPTAESVRQTKGEGDDDDDDAHLPPSTWTLPFSFEYNIKMPLHILEKMDYDVYSHLADFDVWVFNTLYAKFRGTASARKNPRDGRPEVAAVHPFWCLANHDCDPNVTPCLLEQSEQMNVASGAACALTQAWRSAQATEKGSEQGGAWLPPPSAAGHVTQAQVPSGGAEERSGPQVVMGPARTGTTRLFVEVLVLVWTPSVV